MTENLIDAQVAAVFAPVISLVLLSSALIGSVKIIKGPTIIDRVIGTDVLLATMLGALGAFIALTGRFDILPVLLAASMFAATGTIAISRYITRSSAALGYTSPASDEDDDDGGDMDLLSDEPHDATVRRLDVDGGE